MPNRPEYAAIWFGLVRAGVGVALVNTNLTGEKPRPQPRRRQSAKAVIVDAALAQSAFASARRKLDRPRRPSTYYGEAAGRREPRLDLEIAAFLRQARRRSPDERPALTLD